MRLRDAGLCYRLRRHPPIRPHRRTPPQRRRARSHSVQPPLRQPAHRPQLASSVVHQHRPTLRRPLIRRRHRRPARPSPSAQSAARLHPPIHRRTPPCLRSTPTDTRHAHTNTDLRARNAWYAHAYRHTDAHRYAYAIADLHTRPPSVQRVAHRRQPIRRRTPPWLPRRQPPPTRPHRLRPASSERPDALRRRRPIRPSRRQRAHRPPPVPRVAHRRRRYHHADTRRALQHQPAHPPRRWTPTLHTYADANADEHAHRDANAAALLQRLPRYYSVGTNGPDLIFGHARKRCYPCPRRERHRS